MTVKTKHVNEVHVNTDIGHYVLDVVSLPGAKATDYVSHIICALENAVSCYCTLNPDFDQSQILSEVKMKITSTMSDRAAVNHCVVKDLEKYVGHELLELNCNIHPLDSLAIAFRKLTKAFELENKVTSNLPGNESVLIKVIQAISKMKYKVSSGEPKQLKAFLISKTVDINLLERYVGNRFHVIFSLCGNIYYLLEVLLEYFTNVCEKPTAKHVLSLLQLSIVQSELHVGGLFGKSVSGPWMKCLYKKASLSNLDSAKILDNAHKTLLQVVERPSLLWQEGFSCFNVEDCKDDPVAKHIRAVPPTGFELELVTRTAKAFQAVMERQLVQYLQGGELYHMPPERVVLGTNAPVDNMVSESVLGYADSLFRRSNIATDAHNAAKIGYATNKTSDWVENLNDSNIYGIIGKSRSIFEKSRIESRSVQQQICDRLIDKLQQQKQQKEKKEHTLRFAIKQLIQDPDHFFAGILSHNSKISSDLIETAFCIVKSPNSLLGKEFTWKEDGDDNKSFHHRVVDCKDNGGCVNYLSMICEIGEDVGKPQDFIFPLHNFLASFLLRNAYFE